MDAFDHFRKISQTSIYPKESKKICKSEDIKPDVSKLSVFPEEESNQICESEDIKPNISKDEYNFDREDEVSRFRNNHKIKVKGKGVIPPPIRTFEELNQHGISEHIIRNIKAWYQEPTPIQMQTIPLMMSGRNVFACAPTGSGKTMAFLIPILGNLKRPCREGFRALILCPTRELAKQTYKECLLLAEHTDLKPHFNDKVGKGRVGPKFAKKFDILITTPNKLIYILKQDAHPVSLSTVQWLVVDESDKLFETGEGTCFREQLAEIWQSCDNKDIKRAMFSATYTPLVAGWCTKHIKKLVSITVGHRNTPVNNVEQSLVFASHDDNGKKVAWRQLRSKGIQFPMLIFVSTKERATNLSRELIADRLKAAPMHSDLTQLQRDNTVQAFKEGKLWILVCTDLMGRGIDFTGVKLVLNYDFPPTVGSYVHRIGRTGRAGLPGKAITFFTVGDMKTKTMKSILVAMKDSGYEGPTFLMEYFKLIDSTKQLDELQKFMDRKNRKKIKNQHYRNNDHKNRKRKNKGLTTVAEKKQKV